MLETTFKFNVDHVAQPSYLKVVKTYKPCFQQRDSIEDSKLINYMWQPLCLTEKEGFFSDIHELLMVEKVGAMKPYKQIGILN